MHTFDQLELELNNLTKKNKELEAKQKQLKDAYDSRIKTIEENAGKRIKEETQRIKSAADAVIRNETSRIMAENQKRFYKLQDEYETLKRETMRERERLEAELNKVKAETTKFINEGIRKTEEEKREAENSLKAAKNSKEQVRKMPYESICKGQFEACSQELDSADSLLQKMFYPSALALARAAGFNFELLGASIDEKVKEWKSYYETLKEVVDIAFRTKESFYEQPWTDDGQTFDELDAAFWSCGHYRSIINSLEEKIEVISKVNQMGEYEYLKTEDAKNVEWLQNAIEETLTNISLMEEYYIFSRKMRKADLERAAVCQFLEKRLLQDQNLIPQAAENLEADSESFNNRDFIDMMERMGVDSFDEDKRKGLSLSFSHGEKSIDIILIPVVTQCHSGLNVNNLMLINVNTDRHNNHMINNQMAIELKNFINSKYCNASTPLQSFSVEIVESEEGTEEVLHEIIDKTMTAMNLHKPKNAESLRSGF